MQQTAMAQEMSCTPALLRLFLCLRNLSVKATMSVLHPAQGQTLLSYLEDRIDGTQDSVMTHL